MTQPPANVYAAVQPIAAQYNVPDPIWEDIVQMESGYNPNAVGDQGTSFGLFQLHQGGALTTSPSSVIGTGGMTQNAIEAMPRIGQAWSALSPSFDPNSVQWWQNFAAQSGHPGGSPGNAITDNAAQALMNDYTGGTTPLGQNTTNPLSPYTVLVSQTSCPWYCNLTPFAQWGPCSGCATPGTNSASQAFSQGITDVTDPGWWARVGVILLGGGLIVIGMMKFMK
jgi:hypothetical protein